MIRAGLLPEPVVLDLNRTQVSDLGVLAGMGALEQLRITGTPVRDIGVLYALPGLYLLDLDYAILQDPEQWAILDELYWLSCINREEWEQSLPGRKSDDYIRLRRGTAMYHMS